MVNYAGCYPGQGAQKPQMALDFYAQFASVRELFVLASDISGKNLWSLLANGDETELMQTQNTQLAVTLVNRSATLALQEMGLSLACHAGFSLGELSAYRAAGIIDDVALFTIVTKRGKLFANASAQAEKKYGELGMAAIVGLGFVKVQKILKEAGVTQVFCANDNSPTQVVISGVEKEINLCAEKLKEAGAKRIIPLRVSGPFHTPFMDEIEEEFAEFLKIIMFTSPQMPVYTNVTGKLISSGREAKQACSRQLSSPVRWTTIMQSIVEDQNLFHALELGPGTVLTGLWKSSGFGVSCKSAGTYNQIMELAEGFPNE